MCGLGPQVGASKANKGVGQQHCEVTETASTAEPAHQSVEFPLFEEVAEAPRSVSPSGVEHGRVWLDADDVDVMARLLRPRSSSVRTVPRHPVTASKGYLLPAPPRPYYHQLLVTQFTPSTTRGKHSARSQGSFDILPSHAASCWI